MQRFSDQELWQLFSSVFQFRKMSEGMWGNKFHSRCGELIVLSNGNKTAVRSSATHEFNHGLVFSHAPLNDYQIFEVVIDAKVRVTYVSRSQNL